jgi:carboxylate-amine ligase
VPTTALIHELLEFVDDVIDDLDSREEINYVHKILEMGTGSDRQLRVWEQSYDLKNVTDYIIDETHTGLDLRK